MASVGNVTIRIRVDAIPSIDHVIWYSILGDRQAAVAVNFQRINPFWYLNGEQVGEDDFH